MDTVKKYTERQDDPTIVIINQKRRKSFEKKGVIYVQEGFAAEPSEVAKFEKIVYSAGIDKDYAYRTLMRHFNRASGVGIEAKQAGDLYDKNNLADRAKEAIIRISQELGLR
jgi:hypothetical protein